MHCWRKEKTHSDVADPSQPGYKQCLPASIPTTPRTENMVRDISLLVYHSQLFPAHWGLWVPSAGNPTVGKVIHVTGDSFSGFGHELKRGYSTVNTDRKPDLFLLANVEDRHIVDTPVCGVDTIAVDDIERIALATPAPVKSLNRASGEVWSPLPVLSLRCLFTKFDCVCFFLSCSRRKRRLSS